MKHTTLLGTVHTLSNYLLTPYKRRGAGITAAKKKFNTHLSSKRSVIERAFGLLALRFPRLTFLKVKTDEKRILCVAAACVLHNWCLMEDDDDESSFDNIEDAQALATDVCNNIPASAVMGHKRASGGGTTIRDLYCEYIQRCK